MLTKIVHPLIALALVSALVTVPSPEAQAGHGAGIAAGIAAGIIGLGILGAAAGSRRGDYYEGDYVDGGDCYAGPRECRWHNQRCFENLYGDWVCRGGEYVCRRPLTCE